MKLFNFLASVPLMLLCPNMWICSREVDPALACCSQVLLARFTAVHYYSYCTESMSRNGFT